ncbi:ABC transporter C family protein [Medicago truncatula]|uniref:ABC-type xenobiotic transporter n=1 Tax=Medicago truncatula TaxID=3880 RepID=G7LC54_MEDTR|nr:ABC transporter C family protein [Medicago truncatula]
MNLINGYSLPKFNIAAAMEWLCLRIDMLSLIRFVFSLIFLISESTWNHKSRHVIQVRHRWSSFNDIDSLQGYVSIQPFQDENSPDPSWPAYGEVDIRNLQVRYAPHLPLVLCGLTCTFRGGLKTGIVGRTGSGKSTLIQTLFRLVEPTVGVLIIDNINISTIGLHDLRSRLTIIPQVPTMFEGTVRSNLALDKCQLGDEVRKKEGNMGQRQIVFLGRVLLKKSKKILVLDEATASVDTATDNLFQPTLMQHFTDSTYITIAHRITSILD